MLLVISKISSSLWPSHFLHILSQFFIPWSFSSLCTSANFCKSSVDSSKTAMTGMALWDLTILVIRAQTLVPLSCLLLNLWLIICKIQVSACCGIGSRCVTNLFCISAKDAQVVGTCTDSSWVDDACPFLLSLFPGSVVHPFHCWFQGTC